MGLNKYTRKALWENEVNEKGKFVTIFIVSKIHIKILVIKHTKTFYSTNLAVNQSKKNIFFTEYYSYYSEFKSQEQFQYMHSVSKNIYFLYEVYNFNHPAK